MDHSLNIHWQVITEYWHHSQYTVANLTALMGTLHLLMKNTMIQFDDLFFLQKIGMLMGRPPTPPYATLYFSVHENTCCNKYLEVNHYWQYLEDVWGLWLSQTTNTTMDDAKYNSFQQDMNSFRKLYWVFIPCSTKAIYSNLVTHIKDNGTITTMLYEKPINLHLFLSLHLTHLTGLLKGLVMESVLQIYKLTSDKALWPVIVNHLYWQLIAWGYKCADLLDLFHIAKQNVIWHSQQEIWKETITTNEKRVYFHLNYHPTDPASNLMQKLFQEYVFGPSYWPVRQQLPLISHVSTKCNPTRSPMWTNRLIIYYHRPPNLGNFLSSKTIDTVNSHPVSAFIQTKVAITHTLQQEDSYSSKYSIHTDLPFLPHTPLYNLQY